MKYTEKVLRGQKNNFRVQNVAPLSICFSIKYNIFNVCFMRSNPSLLLRDGRVWVRYFFPTCVTKWGWDIGWKIGDLAEIAEIRGTSRWHQGYCLSVWVTWCHTGRKPKQPAQFTHLIASVREGPRERAREKVRKTKSEREHSEEQM